MKIAKLLPLVVLILIGSGCTGFKQEIKPSERPPVEAKNLTAEFSAKDIFQLKTQCAPFIERFIVDSKRNDYLVPSGCYSKRLNTCIGIYLLKGDIENAILNSYHINDLLTSNPVESIDMSTVNDYSDTEEVNRVRSENTKKRTELDRLADCIQ